MVKRSRMLVESAGLMSHSSDSEVSPTQNCGVYQKSIQLNSSLRGAINFRQVGAFAQTGNRNPAAFLSGTMNPRLYRARVTATYILF